MKLETVVSTTPSCITACWIKLLQEGGLRGQSTGPQWAEGKVDSVFKTLMLGARTQSMWTDSVYLTFLNLSCVDADHISIIFEATFNYRIVLEYLYIKNCRQ